MAYVKGIEINGGVKTPAPAPILKNPTANTTITPQTPIRTQQQPVKTTTAPAKPAGGAPVAAPINYSAATAPAATSAPAPAATTPSVDIAKLIADAVKAGASDAYIQSLAAQRDLKIASDPTKYAGTMSTADYLKSLGYSPMPTQPQQVSPLPDMNVTSQFTDQRTALNNQLNQILNPQNFTTILQQIMQQLMPTYNAQKGEVSDLYGEASRQIDLDAERRGVYDSGVAAGLQQKNAVDKVRTMSNLLAALQKDAVGQVNNTVGQQLQGIGMQGDWLSSDRNAALQQLQTQLGALFNQDASNLGWAKLGQDNSQFNSSMAEQIRQFDANYKQNDQQWQDKMKLEWEGMTLQQKAQEADKAYKEAMARNNDPAKQNLRDQMEMASEAYIMVDQLLGNGASSADILTMIAPYQTLYPELYNDLSKSVDRYYNGGVTSPSAGLSGIPNYLYDNNGSTTVQTPPPSTGTSSNTNSTPASNDYWEQLRRYYMGGMRY